MRVENPQALDLLSDADRKRKLEEQSRGAPRFVCPTCGGSNIASKPCCIEAFKAQFMQRKTP